MAYPCWSCTNALYYGEMEQKNFTDAWTVIQNEDDKATAAGLEAFFPDTSQIVTKTLEVTLGANETSAWTMLYDKKGDVTPTGNILVLKKTGKRYTSIGNKDLVAVATGLQQ